MMDKESKRPVTVEDLLHVKRAERPKAEFWLEFDRELRTKQLSALVEKRPWWKTLPARIAGLGRYHIPIGATAVLAVTLLSLRDSHTVPAAQVPIPAEIAGDGMEVTDTAPTARASGAAVAMVVEPVAAEPEAVRSELALSSEATAPGELARMVPLLAAEDDANAEDLRPSARSIAENRAVAEAMLGTAASGFEARALPLPVNRREPLAQMSNPAETRRSRFAVAFAAAGSAGLIQAQPTRSARRLSEQELYDTIHRFGASGNSLSVKF